MFASPSPETVGLTPKYKAPTPVAPARRANRTALRREIKPRTRGLLRVLDILASVDGSYSMFSAFALAEHRVVPEVRKSRVSGLRDGVSVMLGASISGTG
jgi:hypothetical protein